MPVAQMKLNILIVDDEKEACTNLKNILCDYIDKDIEVCGIAHNTRDAEKLIQKYQPDVVFLDIEMPNENAFSFLDRIAPFSFEVVFVTAYDEYAIKAFKLNAVDYILKPISISELSVAVTRVKERIYYRRLTSNDVSSYHDVDKNFSARAKLQRITLRDNNNIEVIEFRELLYVEAQGSYSKIIFVKDELMKEVVMSTSIAEYEELLPADIFFRIHKSYLINCQHIKKILRDDTNYVVMCNDIVLPVSRRRYSVLLDFLKTNEYYNE